MLNKSISWLHARPFVNLIILITYYSFVVLPHEWIGIRINALFKPLGREQYNLLILVLAIAAIIIIALFFRKQWKSYQYKNQILPYIFGSAILLAICFKFLFVINIEIVHIPQYAIFAMLAYPLLKNVISVMFLATSFGALDELYQYVILTPHINKYFDFNDVFIDQIGAGIGLLILVLSGVKDKALNLSSIIKDPGVASVIILIVIFFLGLITGDFSIYDPEGIDRFTLIKEQATSYWTRPKGPPAVFHRLGIWESVVCIATALLFYGSMHKLTLRKVD